MAMRIKKDLRPLIRFIWLHCTATKPNMNVTKAHITTWHTSPVSQGGRGWSIEGYSDLYTLSGKRVNIVPYNDDQYIDPWEITNGIKGANRFARSIVYAGGIDYTGRPADTRTEPQKTAMEADLKSIIKQIPTIIIGGHNQIDPSKACPSFDVPQWLKSIGIDDVNIYNPKAHAHLLR